MSPKVLVSRCLLGQAVRYDGGCHGPFDILQRWQADLSYSSFWGGEGTTNRLSDRDFASFNVKYSF